MSSPIAAKHAHAIAVFAAITILNGCQSNGIAPQSPSSSPQNALQATTSAQSQRTVSLYSATELPTLGGDLGSGFGINNQGLIAALVFTTDDALERAVIIRDTAITDLGTLGGPNSYATNISNSGIVSGASDTSTIDPNGEGWCAGDPTTCHPFYWRAGEMHALPILDGNNAVANSVNSAGEIAGWATTLTHLGNCSNRSDFKAVRWDSRTLRVTPLPEPSGDVLSAGLGINDPGTPGNKFAIPERLRKHMMRKGFQPFALPPIAH